jgi:Carboxypeptidase regulatory-like domain/TonB dependent receptor
VFRVISPHDAIDNFLKSLPSLANFRNLVGIPEKGGSATMTFARLVYSACWLTLMVSCFAAAAKAQTETATISGLITDDTGAVVPGAEVKLQSVERGVAGTATTNNAGIYVFPSVHPGQYQLTVHKPGFKQVDFVGMIINVQDHIEQNFRLQVGSVAESVTVEATAPTINTQDASVSTVVDRKFAENLPLNGRSFQTLIYLTPGVVATTASGTELGQFSVNGQRADTNYFTIDGVSANFGASPATATLAQSAGGASPSFTAQGGTNGLVSVDAMEEFRIDTSTYSPEFGRSPGAQISIVTRSGTNAYHGTLFEYLRNDVFDANDWFADQNGLPKAAERQNDFGGVLGGPIVKDKTFFFLSYEGLRLKLPQTGITTVPSLDERQSAPASIQPFLNAFPLPNGADLGNGQASFNQSFSNRSSLDSYSIRIDQTLSSKVNLFGRYSYAPSQIAARGEGGGTSLSNLLSEKLNSQSFTLGATGSINASMTDEFRFSYGRSSASAVSSLDTFGGALVPSDSSIFVSPFTSKNSTYFFDVFSGQQLGFSLGKSSKNLQQQINAVDSLSIQKGTHRIKLGIDYRRLAPSFNPEVYAANTFFSDVPTLVAGQTEFTIIQAARPGSLVFHNLSVFAQDTWNATPRLTLTYGSRWELNPPPSGSLPLFAVTGIQNLSSLGVAAAGTPPWKTTYGNFAPRLGVAYQLSQHNEWNTVLRAGFGVFYDLSTQQVGDALSVNAPPFGASQFEGSTSFPLTPTSGAPPTIPSAPPFSNLIGFDPNLKLPYTLEWNVAGEQALGVQQAISVSYVGAVGRRLLQEEFPLAPNDNFGEAQLYENVGSSNYNALQVQFQRRVSHGLEALASYTCAHSIDTASTGGSGSQPTLFAAPDLFVRALGANANRGPSDFDIRNSASGAVTYDIPTPPIHSFARSIVSSWSLQSVLLVRSAPPVEVFNSQLAIVDNSFVDVRPDVVPGQPQYLHGPQYAGGRVLNPAAFTNPPLDPITGQPLRQGDLGRNALRGFGATQLDFAVHRNFHIRESLKLQFRAEFFNLLNHPNFANPVGDTSSAFFGQSTQMLGRSLGQGGFGLNSLYQIGGPRSVQFALKLQF